MGVVGVEKYARRCFSWLISVLIIVLAFALILIFKQLGQAIDNEKFKIVPTKYCDHD